ncbi:hypothetical protein CBR_g46711 [Chara braunii]|uniref:Integrase catalytic domain-containing protein n=1 Tax=Chara braunii TaxID=69332 RepID=A0A388K478_CHABU|nr:hypothetical protein CBR_g46711 [Chara braunii]|eukprot:GBG64753.1 hypothetical protein CBR_g46711 [Chara braunii]
MLDAADENERPFFQKLYDDVVQREREAEAAARAANIADQVALLRIPEANADRFQEGLAAAIGALVRLRTLEDLESRVIALEQRNQELQAEILSLKQSQLSAPRPPNPRSTAVPISQSNTVLMARASGTVTSAGTDVSSSSGSTDSFALVIVPNEGTSAQNATVLAGVQYSGPVVDKRAATLSSKYDGKADITSWISSMRSYFEVMRTPQEDRSMFMGTNTEPAVRNHIELQAVAAGYEKIDLTEWLKQFDWAGMKGTLKNLLLNVRSISIDFTDMGKVSEAGNSQVMVIVDRFSKFLNLIPFPPHAPTELVIEEFHQQYILQFGIPKTIVSDRDTRFISKDWKDSTSQIYDIKPNKTSGRHPEANGLAEEINQTVIQLLRALIVPDQNTWEKELHKVKGLYNNSIHSASGVTPIELQYGWPMRNPLSYLFPEQSPGLMSGMPGYNAKYARLLKVVIAAMNKRQHAMIKHANKLRKEEKFKVGDYVRVKMSEFSDEEGISRKLLPLYYGPWQILNVIGDDFGPSYVIDAPPHLRTYPVFHASKLFPRIDDETSPFRDPMIPRPIDGGHEIDRIVSHEGRGRNRQYKVHFLYHPLTEFFWIDRKELLKNAHRGVNAYERQITEGQTAKFVATMTPHGLTKSLFLIYSYDEFCANSE